MSKNNVHQVAAAILLRSDGKILLLKRSPSHSTNAGKWCFVTGYVEEGETPPETAQRELREELSITASPVAAGEIVIVNTEWGDTLHVHPFLFEIAADVEIKLDDEHVMYKWIEPSTIYDYDIVQQLDEDLMALGLL